MGTMRAAMGDAVLTFMWVFSVPFLGVLTPIAASALGVIGNSMAGFLIATALATLLILLFSVIGNVLGGASFNPCSTAALYAAGLKPDSSLISMAVRFPAQAAGGALGAKAILGFMPVQYKFLLKGPSLKVGVHSGAMAEGLLTFALNFGLLLVFLRGPRNPLLKVYLLAFSTVVLITAGSAFTGPSMNPANAFGWAYVYNWHNSWEQFYVYWVCPLLGAVLAAKLFLFLLPPPPPKDKKA